MGVWGLRGLRRGCELLRVNPCHLRSPVELIQTQFPRFAGILGIRRRRHGDRAQTSPPGLHSGGGGVVGWGQREGEGGC